MPQTRFATLLRTSPTPPQLGIASQWEAAYTRERGKLCELFRREQTQQKQKPTTFNKGTISGAVLDFVQTVFDFKKILPNQAFPTGFVAFDGLAARFGYLDITVRDEDKVRAVRQLLVNNCGELSAEVMMFDGDLADSNRMATLRILRSLGGFAEDSKTPRGSKFLRHDAPTVRPIAYRYVNKRGNCEKQEIHYFSNSHSVEVKHPLDFGGARAKKVRPKVRWYEMNKNKSRRGIPAHVRGLYGGKLANLKKGEQDWRTASRESLEDKLGTNSEWPCARAPL